MITDEKRKTHYFFTNHCQPSANTGYAHYLRFQGEKHPTPEQKNFEIPKTLTKKTYTQTYDILIH